ncbi:hypothetical protein I4U23_011203 [Adineta vaga]|nr:hypothetical protein I4U23_011203 [Adineta vaga]
MKKQMVGVGVGVGNGRYEYPPDTHPHPLVGEHGIQLSGGEKQHIALARALVKQPSLLLLDEITSALDNKNEKIVLDTLDQVCKGRTTIVIAHRLATVRNAHRIYVLANGNVIEKGTHQSLVSKEGGKYRAIFDAQEVEHPVENSVTIISEEKHEHSNEECLLAKRSDLTSDLIKTDMKLNSSSSSEIAVFWRLLKMNSPEWITLLIGHIACLISELVQPSCAILLTKVLNFTAFALPGSKLTRRIRAKAFALFAVLSCELVLGFWLNWQLNVQFAYPYRTESLVSNSFQMTIKHHQRVALVGEDGTDRHTLRISGMKFYVFENFLNQISCKLTSLCLTTETEDMKYLDANHWEYFLLKNYSQLKEFQLKCYNNHNHILEYGKVNQFITSF